MQRLFCYYNIKHNYNRKKSMSIKVLFLVFFLQSLAFTKTKINVEESNTSIVINISDLSDYGERNYTIYNHPPIDTINPIHGLRLPLALDYKNIESIDYDSSFVVKVNNLGEYKGVKKTLITLFPETENYPKNTEITLTLRESINLSNKKINIPIKYLKILNKRHLKFLIEKYHSNIKNTKRNKLQSNHQSWMKDGVEYFKFGTSENGIGRLSYDDLNSFIPSGTNIHNIHIKLYGEDFNHFYVNSADDVFSQGDEIYFLAKFQHGDTTYYDHYTKEVNYYLYVDESRLNDQLKLISNQNQNFIKEIPLKKRIEIEGDYSLGSEVRALETHTFEGWYQKLLRPVNNRDDESSVFINTISDVTKTHQIKYYYSYLYFPELVSLGNDNLYKNEFLINNNLIGETDTVNIDIRSDEEKFWERITSFDAQDFIKNGPNKITFKSKFISDKENGSVALDYNTFDYSGIAQSENGKIEIESNFNENSYTKVYNFKSENIISIDTINNTIGFLNSDRSQVYAGNINNEFLGISIDDYLYTVDNPNKTYFLSYFTDDYIYGELELPEDLDQSVLKSNNSPLVIAISDRASAGLLSELNLVFGTSLRQGDFSLLFRFANGEVYTISDSESISSFRVDESNQAQRFLAEMEIPNKRSYQFLSDSESFVSTILKGKKSKPELLTNLEGASTLLITHKDLWEFAVEWKSYRENQGHKIRLVDVEDIYDSFSEGRKSPHSIKNFLRFASENYSLPEIKNVFLVGDTSWDPNFNLNNSVAIDKVPTYGRPYSDMWFGMLGDSTNSSRFDIFVSRITPRNITEAMDYLAKVKTFESLENQNWFKNFFGLVGGSQNEVVSFSRFSTYQFETLANSPLKADTIVLRKEFGQSSSAEQTQQIRTTLNSGVIWTNFFGHGAFDIVDFGGWNTAQLSNVGKTGILSTVSCNNGAYGEPSKHRSRNEDQVLVPEKGFVIALGGTSLGDANISNDLFNELIYHITDTTLNLRNVCDILYVSLSDYFPDSPFLDFYTLTYNMLGDPLIELPISKKEDYYIIENSIKLKDDDGVITFDEEFAEFEFEAYNSGLELTNPDILVIHQFENEIDTIIIGKYNDIPNHIFEFKLSTALKIGNHNLDIIIDNNEISQDTDRSNNKLSFSFEVFDRNLIRLDPLNGWNLSNKNLIRFLNPFNDENIEVEFRIFDSANNIVNPIQEIIIDRDVIDLRLSNLIDNKIYFLEYRSKFENNWSNWERIKFNTIKSPDNFVHFDLINDVELVNLKNDNNVISFDTLFTDYEILSLPGGNTPLNAAFINIDGNTLVEQYQLGYYFLIFDKFNRVEPIFRHYNTFGWFYYVDKEPEFIDSLNFDMIEFMQDSLTKDQIVLVATSGPAQYQFEQYCDETFCHIDTLVENLKRIGSKRINRDSILTRSSISMVGGLEFDDNYFNEDIKTDSDTSKISGIFPLTYYTGKITTDLVGPVKEWNYLKFDYTGIIEFTINIYDQDKKLLINYENKDSISLETFNEKKLRFEILISRTDDTEDFHINNLYTLFEPVSELSLNIQDNPNEDILRGDLAEYLIGIKNLSLRTDSEGAKINSVINGVSLTGKNPLEIEANTQISEPIEINSTSLVEINNVIFNLSLENDDLYTFNNSTSSFFRIVEDNIPPRLIPKINKIVVNDGDFIPINSEISIELLDNSRLGIQDLGNFTMIRLNGFVEDEDVIFENDFDPDEELKARITLPNDRLNFGDNLANLLNVIAVDASNNVDTLFIYLNVSRNGRVFNLLNYPNPFENTTSIKFELIAPEIHENDFANIHIYDSFGNLIKNIETPIIVGKNEVAWDGKDNLGNSVPVGRYYYLVLINSSTFFPDLDAGIGVKLR